MSNISDKGYKKMKVIEKSVLSGPLIGILLLALGGPILLLSSSALLFLSMICIGLWFMTLGFYRASPKPYGFQQLSELWLHRCRRLLLTGSILATFAVTVLFFIEIFWR